MTPNDYVKKYKLVENDRFDHSTFVEDLRKDFIDLLNWYVSKPGSKEKVPMTEDYFFNAVRDMSKRFDTTFVFAKREKPLKLWKYFYAIIVVPERDRYGYKKGNKRIHPEERSRSRDN